jgi:hypothetical protein
MHKLINLSIIAGLTIAAPNILFAPPAATAQTTAGQTKYFKSVDFYVTGYSVSTGSSYNTVRLNFNVRSRINNLNRLKSIEQAYINRIELIERKTGERYTPSSIDADKLSEGLKFNGDTAEVKLEFELPQGTWPSHLELDTGDDKPMKIRI